MSDIKLDNVRTTVEHFENGERSFNTAHEFINFVQSIYLENEEPDESVKMPKSYGDAIAYVKEYCDNYKVVRRAIGEITQDTAKELLRQLRYVSNTGAFLDFDFDFREEIKEAIAMAEKDELYNVH